MDKKRIIGIILGAMLIVAIVVIAIVSDIVKDKNSNQTIVEESKTSNSTFLADYNGEDASWDDSIAEHITLNGSTASSDKNNVTIDNNLVKITKEGIYVFEGNFNGQIQVETDVKVRIILNGVEIISQDGPAIYVVNAEKVYITAVDGTENKLTDTTNYTDQEPTATIYSKDDLIFNGTGKLNVIGNYKDGIVSKDDLKIWNGNIVVEAMNNGIKGKDSVKVVDGNINIKAKNDGIKTTNDTDKTKGYILISGGNIKIEAGHDGIQAQTILNIEGETIDIVSGEGSNSSNVSTTTNDMFFIRGQWGQQSNTFATEEDSGSYKGIKASGNIVISGGEITIDSADDGIHSNSDINISQGTITVDSGDDAIHADGLLQIDGGNLTLNAHEGLEATFVKINNGTISITASDDGINAGNKSNAYTTTIEINGGNISINMGQGDTDAIDSNGNIYINGGTINITAQSAFDYDGEAKYSGGELIVNGTKTTSITNQFGGQMRGQQMPQGGQMYGGPRGI